METESKLCLCLYNKGVKERVTCDAANVSLPVLYHFTTKANTESRVPKNDYKRIVILRSGSTRTESKFTNRLIINGFFIYKALISIVGFAAFTDCMLTTSPVTAIFVLSMIQYQEKPISKNY